MTKPKKSGAELLQGDDANIVSILRTEVLLQAAKARRDPIAFFEFVMRDFSENKPIKLMPHQIVALEFILAHDRSVNMWPIGTSKTFIMTGLTLFFLGQNPTTRGAIVSASEEQAAKIVGMVRDYVDRSIELRMVFPHLQRSTKQGDPWTQTAITIERPPGIKDASLTAYGLNSDRIIGSRLSWIIVDDVLNGENTNTKEQRDKTKLFLDQAVLSRLDPKGSRAVFTNTPWHPDDAIHELSALTVEGRGWATMRMDIYGDIEIYDDQMRIRRAERLGLEFEPWDSKHLRAKTPDPTDPICRLVAHDPDPHDAVPLWPERYPVEWIEEKQRTTLPHVFNQQLRCICRDDATSMCKLEYIVTCLKVARDNAIFNFVSSYRGPNLTFTGLDLAVSPGEEHDDTAFFTFEARPDGLNVILDVEIGQWGGPDILDKLFEKAEQYNSVVRVENNAAQDYIRQFALRRNKSVPVKPHTTGRAKAHPEHGVPAIFVELMNGAWALPNRSRVDMHPFMKKLIDACLYYIPSKHTDDVLMAMYFAREQKKEWLGVGGSPPPGSGGGVGSFLTR